MSPPFSTSGAPATKNGPNTVDSVAPSGTRWLIPITSIDTPSTSESRMNSWRRSSLIWPVAREEVDRGRPLLLGRLDLRDEGVQVAHEALRDLRSAATAALLEARQDGRR